MRPCRAWGAAAGSGIGAAALLLLAYVLTLAPDVTLWDSGELVAAARTLGIPHPPGNPLYVLLGRVWTLPATPERAALAVNLLSAAATAGACGLLATLMARWTASGWWGLAAGITAGAVSSVWRSATEAEVYALALLLSAALIAAADRAGREGDPRWAVLVAYLLALAAPLHVLALVAAPAAVLLAATDSRGRVHWSRGGALGAVALAVAGVGTASGSLLLGALLLGALALLMAALPPSRAIRDARRAAAGVRWLPLWMVAAAALGLSALLVLLVRAQADPYLNEGAPASFAALADVLGRRQYAVAPLWPRQAPLWLQVGNLLEYADWQFALGLAPGPAPGWGRTSVTVLYALLGIRGSMEHRRLDRRGWLALSVLVVTASFGVLLYLNLKAGPSYGHGLLPEGAPREARERDYFFALAFWGWGAWAGVGAMVAARAIARRLRQERRFAIAAGLALALMPLALNWRAVDRSLWPDSALALDVGRALLDAAPPGAVLLTAGDLDSYPVWYMQAVHGSRLDVTVVVVPMLPAAWYRSELARRHALLAPPGAGGWAGESATLAELAADARERGRPLAASALLSAREREAAGARWLAAGVLYVRGHGGSPDGSVDTVTASRTAALVRRQLPDPRDPGSPADPAARRMRSLLACAPLLMEASRVGADATLRGLLASWCNLP